MEKVGKAQIFARYYMCDIKNPETKVTLAQIEEAAKDMGNLADLGVQVLFIRKLDFTKENQHYFKNNEYFVVVSPPYWDRTLAVEDIEHTVLDVIPEGEWKPGEAVDYPCDEADLMQTYEYAGA